MAPVHAHCASGAGPAPRYVPGAMQGHFVDEDEVAAAAMDPAIYELPSVDDLEVAAAAAAAALEVLHGGGAGDSDDESSDESSSGEDSSSEEGDSDSSGDESSEASSSDEDVQMADASAAPAARSGPASAMGMPLVAVRMLPDEATCSVSLALSVRPSAGGRPSLGAAKQAGGARGGAQDAAMQEVEPDSSPFTSDSSDDEESDVSARAGACMGALLA